MKRSNKIAIVLMLLVVASFHQVKAQRIDAKIVAGAFAGPYADIEGNVGLAPGYQIGFEFTNKNLGRTIPWILSFDFRHQTFFMDQDGNVSSSAEDMFVFGAGLNLDDYQGRVLFSSHLNSRESNLFVGFEIRKVISLGGDGGMEFYYGIQPGYRFSTKRENQKFNLSIILGVGVYLHKLK